MTHGFEVLPVEHQPVVYLRDWAILQHIDEKTGPHTFLWGTTGGVFDWRKSSELKLLSFNLEQKGDDPWLYEARTQSGRKYLLTAYSEEDVYPLGVMKGHVENVTRDWLNSLYNAARAL